MKKLIVMMICCFAMVGLQAQTADMGKKSCAKTCTKAQKAACAKSMGVSVASFEAEGFSNVKACDVSGKIKGEKVCSSSGKITTKSFNPETKEMTVVTTSADGEVLTEEVTVIEASSANAALTKGAAPKACSKSKKACSKSKKAKRAKKAL